MGRACGMFWGKRRDAYRDLVGKPEGKRPLGRRRCKWEDNIRIDLKVMGFEALDWINVAEDRVNWRDFF